MRLRLVTVVAFAATVAYASDCPSGDEMLKRNTSLTSLCPNGFTSRGGGSLEDAIQRQKGNVSMVYASAQDTGVPADLALAVSYHESVGFNSCAGSDTGVKGPMQLTQSTGRAYGFDRDINEQNIKGGMAVLKKAYDKCGYDYACLSANYNGSPRPGEQQGWARGVQAATTKLKNNPALVASACNKGATASCFPNDIGNPSLPGTSVAQLPTETSSDGSSVATNSPTAAMASIIVGRS